MDAEITVFTDGAARNNPGPGGWGAIVATADGEVTELGGASPRTTNNQMEMTAAAEALRFLAGHRGRVVLCTDSNYLIQGITAWIHGWRKRGWTTAQGQPVLNRELWEDIDVLVRARGPGKVSWRHVPGHAGIDGNERCDEIATKLADGLPVTLYRGPRASYGVSLEIPEATAKKNGDRSPGNGGRKSKSGVAYSYLSLVGGELQRHATWADCERRVRGISGARFRRAESAADEAGIAREWGARLPG